MANAQTVNGSRSYQSESNWLAIFPSLCLAMKKQVIKNAPSTVSSVSIFYAILRLPTHERGPLIKSLPVATLKKLISELPRNERVNISKILTAAVSRPQSSNEMRDHSIQTSLQSSKTGQNVNYKEEQSSSQVRMGRKRKVRYSRRRMNKQFGSSKTKNKENRIDISSILAVSDYDDDFDCDLDACASHISISDFKREVFVMTAVKMMRAFGDARRPSRFSAVVIINHILCYLHSMISKMESAKAMISSKNKKVPKLRTGKKASMFYLDLLEQWYPLQVTIFRRWKFMKYSAKKHENDNAPNLDDNSCDDDCDEDLDGKESKEKEEKEEKESYMDLIRNESRSNDSYECIDLSNGSSVDIGWGRRLVECDEFTNSMRAKDYLKFSKCREASLTSYKKRFYQWLGVDDYGKILTYFLGFIAWDRIGCIVQVARAQKGIHGIIQDNDKYITPSEAVKAIWKVNNTKSITPIDMRFVDSSLNKIGNWKMLVKSWELDDRMYVERKGKNKNNKKRELINENDQTNNNKTNKKRRIK